MTLTIPTPVTLSCVPQTPPDFTNASSSEGDEGSGVEGSESDSREDSVGDSGEDSVGESGEDSEEFEDQGSDSDDDEEMERQQRDAEVSVPALIFLCSCIFLSPPGTKFRFLYIGLAYKRSGV